MITDFSFDSGADGIDDTRIVQAQLPEPSEYLSIKLSFCVLTSGHIWVGSTANSLVPPQVTYLRPFLFAGRLQL